MQIEVIDFAGTGGGALELSDAVYNADVRKDLIHRVVNWQLAKRRSGTHKVKGRSEVRGTTAKMYRQKGTGRARHGSNRGTQFVGGGIVFGPTPRDHKISVPKKIRAMALRSAISAKVKEEKFVVIDDFKSEDLKTKTFKSKLENLGLNNALFVYAGEADRNASLASRNIPHIDILAQEGCNVYDILRHENLVMTKDAAKLLEGRLS